MFICDKNYHCVGCDYQCADKKSDIDAEFADCQHLIEVAPVVHGWWIEMIKNALDAEAPSRVFYKCSKCGEMELFKFSYCHCGAKMDGKETE